MSIARISEGNCKLFSAFLQEGEKVLLWGDQALTRMENI